jgi:5'-3' exonuclease
MGNRRKLKKAKKRVLLVDGEALLRTGFFGGKNVIGNNGRVIAVFYFINTIKRLLTFYNISRVYVFWEGVNSTEYRKMYYPYYKKGRTTIEPDLEDDLNRQRIRVKQYLEELYIRQIEIDNAEADDCIAYFCNTDKTLNKYILTNDRDLLQLLDDDVSVYLIGKKTLITPKNFNTYFKYHYKNVSLMKIIGGDASDNISGIEGVGEGTLLKMLPELITEEKTIDWVKERVKVLHEENKKSKLLQRILSGHTKWGVVGEDYYAIMKKIIDLKDSLLNEDGKQLIDLHITSPIDPEGRGGMKKVQEMMVEDQIDDMLPKGEEAYFNFWMPFISIIKKEQKFYKRS